MPTKGEKRTEVISFKVEPELRTRIEEVAANEHRTVSMQVRKFVLEGLGAGEVRDRRKRSRRQTE